MPIIFALLLTLVAVTDGAAQADAADSAVITLARGTSELLEMPLPITRVAIADSSIANVVVLSPRELLINGSGIGTTTLIVWDADEGAQVRPVEVTVDVASLQRQLNTLFPDENIQVSAIGDMVVLSGMVSGGVVGRQMVEIASAMGARVIENFSCARPSVSCP